MATTNPPSTVLIVPDKKAPAPVTWVTCPHVIIVDHNDSGAQAEDLAKIAAALQIQVQRDFAPLYHVSCTVDAVPFIAGEPPPAIPADAWVIGLFSDPDQPGALGYHDTTPTGMPLAKVFPKLDAQDGSPLSATISHELLEMLADPLLAKAVQSVIDGRFWAYEICDAVENDSYTINGVTVSNFVTPQYFEPPQNLSGVILDFMKLVKKPYEVRPGGYMQYYANGWHQVVNQGKARRAYRSTPNGRQARRQRRAVKVGPAAGYSET